MADAKFKEGDWVRVLHTDYAGDIDVGDVCKVAHVAYSGSCSLTYKSGTLFFYASEIEPWAPRVGERVRALVGGIDITNGREYKVVDFDDDCVEFLDDAGDERSRALDEFEPVTGKAAEPKFKVGDRVQVTDLETFDVSCVSLGSVATVKANDGKFIKLGFAKPFGGEFIQYARPEQIELADTPADEPKFNVGDRVRVTKKGKSGHGRSIGEEFTLSAIMPGNDRYGKFWRTSDGPDFYPDEIELVASADAPKFKVGDRVQVRGHPYHLEADESRGVITSPSRGRGDWEIELDGYGKLNFFESEMELAPTTTPLKIEAGKFYMTRDGRKVGPIEPEGNGNRFWQFKWRRMYYKDTGYSCPGALYDHDGKDDLIAKAPAPTTPPITGTLGTAIVCLIRDGKPLPATEPYVHDDQDSANREMRRLADLHKGDTFGVYKLTATAVTKKPTYDHEWQRLAAGGQKIAAIRELRGITGLGLKATKDAVEDWLQAA